MTTGLVLHVEDLAGHLEKKRQFSGNREITLSFDEARVDGPISVTGTLTGTTDGVQAELEISVEAQFTCVRCLTTWAERVATTGSQHYSTTHDEDGYRIVDGTADIGRAAVDEIALALPAAPVCRDDCKGLCPICGTDLNSEPCNGHGDDSGSPFAVLKDLFDS